MTGVSLSSIVIKNMYVLVHEHLTLSRVKIYQLRATRKNQKVSFHHSVPSFSLLKKGGGSLFSADWPIELQGWIYLLFRTNHRTGCPVPDSLSYKFSHDLSAQQRVVCKHRHSFIESSIFLLKSFRQSSMSTIWLRIQVGPISSEIPKE